MEKVPSVSIIKWWSALRPTVQLNVFMAFVIVGLSTFTISVLKENKRLNSENLAGRIECEQRAAKTDKLIYEAVQASDDKNKTKTDSILANCEREKQDLLLQRLYAVAKSRRPLTKILKR